MNLPTPGYGNVEVNNSGADIGGYLTDEDRDWIAGNVQLD